MIVVNKDQKWNEIRSVGAYHKGSFRPWKGVEILSKYGGNSLHGFNELAKSLKNQSGCYGKKEYMWEDQYMGENNGLYQGGSDGIK